MKTKNIFRMLLVAVALLLGANNVKAGEIVLWESTTPRNVNYEMIPFDQSKVMNLAEGDILKFQGSVTNPSDGNRVLALYTSNNNYIIGTYYEWLKDPFVDGIASYKFTEAQATKCADTNYPPNIYCINMTITKVWIETSDVQKYDVNLSFDNRLGNVTANPSKAAEGAQVTLNIQPNDGYSTGSISVVNDATNEVISTTNTFTMPANSVTAMVGFNAAEYTITAGENVTVSKTSAHLNDEITVIAATAPAGYVFECFIVKGDNNQYYTVSNGKFQMPATNVTITALYKIEVTESTTSTTIWGPGSKELNWSDGIEYNPSDFANAQVGDIVRIYGTKGTKESWFNVQFWPINNQNFYVIPWEDKGTGDLHGTGNNTYVEFIITHDLLNIWDGQTWGGIGGYNFTVTEMSWLHNDGTTKENISLSYSSNTASATTASIGNTLNNAPTLTSSVEGLTFTYESSDTNVAEVSTEGIVTIKGVGTTVIKAIFAGNDTYNRAEASYTLTVTEATYAITILEPENGQITVSATEATANTTITITATPNDGYKLSAVSVKAGDTNIEVSGTGNARTFTMPSQNVTVSATFAEIETIEATITSTTSFATFCSNKALDFTGINTIEAYYAKTVENGNVYLLRIYGTVKAGTGLVLKGATTRIPVAESGDELEGNMLIGVSADTDVNASTDYVLTEKNGVAVFAQTGVNKATVAAGHAYLRVPVARARTRAIGIGGEGTTGIENTFIDDCEQGEKVIYNLSGQRVKNPTKGLYIINGKKMIIE